MTSRLDNFTLDHCYCRISIRKEGRAGRSYEKIGYYDLDLASVAGAGNESKACLLNGYQQTNSSPANAYLEIRMKLTILEGDHIFRRFVSRYSFEEKIRFFSDRPDSDHPYIKIEQIPKNPPHEPFSGWFLLILILKKRKLIVDEGCSTMSASAGELYPPPMSNLNRGHSRRASKSNVCSNYSTTSANSANNSNPHDKTHLRFFFSFYRFFSLDLKNDKEQTFFLEMFYTSLVIFTIPILIRTCFLKSGRLCIDPCFI